MPAVLVVDDDALNREVLEAFLTLANYPVRLAHNGASALKQIAQATPDLVILDVKMPDMNGYELCQRIKSNPQTQHIKILLLTAFDGPQERQTGLAAGADAYMTRPFDGEDLIRKVQQLLPLT